MCVQVSALQNRNLEKSWDASLKNRKDIFNMSNIFLLRNQRERRGRNTKKESNQDGVFVGLYFVSVYLHDCIPGDNQTCTVCCKKLAQDLNFCGHHLDVDRQKLAK